MTPEEICEMFRHKDGAYGFARWGRDVAPVVFGVDDATLEVIRASIIRALALAGREAVEIDPDLGANLMLFFFREWDELADVPDMDRMLPDLPGLIGRLKAQGAETYRTFRFDRAGAIRACFSFVRMGGALAGQPADALAMAEAAGMLLRWARPPGLERDRQGQIAPTPAIAALIRAAYDPTMPDAADDPAHALRLWARMQQAQPAGAPRP